MQQYPKCKQDWQHFYMCCIRLYHKISLPFFLLLCSCWQLCEQTTYYMPGPVFSSQHAKRPFIDKKLILLFVQIGYCRSTQEFFQAQSQVQYQNTSSWLHQLHKFKMHASNTVQQPKTGKNQSKVYNHTCEKPREVMMIQILPFTFKCPQN